MSQQAVGAHRHPQPSDHVEGQGEQDLGEIQAVAQLTRATPSRKQPETANVITLADRRSAVVWE